MASLLGVIASAIRSRFMIPAASAAVQAVFNAALASTAWTLSGGNQTAVKTAGVDTCLPLEYFRSTGTYWDEFVLGSGSGVEYQGVALGNASSDWTGTSNYPGKTASNNSGLYLGTSPIWEYAYLDVVSTFSGPTLASGAVICILTKVASRKFFVFVRPSGGGAGSWIGDDPNVTPTGGFAFGFTGDVAIGFYSFYSGTTATHRDAASQTEFSNAPAGTTQCWDNA